MCRFGKITFILKNSGGILVKSGGVLVKMGAFWHVFVEMCRHGDEAANLLFFLWRALWRPTAPASRTQSRRTAEESRTSLWL